MQFDRKKLAHWTTLMLACSLAACGGGGGGGTTTGQEGNVSQAPVPADARSGDYTMYAANGQQYTLNLDFSAKSYHLVGTGADETGTFTPSDDFKIAFFALNQPGGTPFPVNNAKFTQFGDTVVGGFRFNGNVTPFIASRSFVTTLAEAVGPFKFMASTVDPAAVPPTPADNTFFTGDITATGTMRTCNSVVITPIESCPADSLRTGVVTNSGADFIADFGALGKVPFRIAKVGADKVFLRASPSSGTTRRFQVGFDQNTAYGFGSFEFRGAATLGNSFAVTRVSNPDPATSGSLPGSVSSVRFFEDPLVFQKTFNADSVVGGSPRVVLPGLLGITATDVNTNASAGNFFLMRTTDLHVLFSARGNPAVPGMVEIGRRLP